MKSLLNIQMAQCILVLEEKPNELWIMKVPHFAKDQLWQY
jgi:hypothetical protein